MARLEIKRQMGKGDIAAVSELLELAAEVDGHKPLGEHQWLDLVHGGRQGFAGLVAWEPGHDHPVGYAQLARDQAPASGEERHRSVSTWALEYVVDPHHRMAGDGIGETLLRAALDLVGQEGGGHVHLWVPKPTPTHRRVAEAVGLSQGRQLRQLRRGLPVHEEATITVRPFRPGHDERAWLEVNNRAFEWHPEQGGWDLATLRARQQQPWFDPDGFLLHERGGKLAGFCWTKVPVGDGSMGEIYVLAVDPAFRGLGLGRQLLLAGLRFLSRKGLRTAMLYVDSDNEAALRLYESLGFTLDHVDQAFVGDVDPAPPDG